MSNKIKNLNYENLVKHLSMEAQKGSPMFLAGIVFWSLALIAKFILPESVLVWYYLFGIGCVFPLGILIARLMKVNFLASENPLSVFGGLAGGIQIFFAPLIILIALNQPEWIPFVVGILTGAHFLPFMAIYNSRAYLFQTIATAGAVSIIGFTMMEQAYLYIPIALIIVYATTYGLLRRECRLEQSTQDTLIKKEA